MRELEPIVSEMQQLFDSVGHPMAGACMSTQRILPVDFSRPLTCLQAKMFFRLVHIQTHAESGR